MGAAIGLRDDFNAASLRRLARTTKSANQSRRLLALAEIYDGRSRSDAARIGGVTLQIVRDWVVRFNDRGPDGLLDGKAPGKPSLLNGAQRQALAEVVESGPIPAIHLWTPQQTQAIFEGYRHVLGCYHLSGLYYSEGDARLYASD